MQIQRSQRLNFISCLLPARGEVEEAAGDGEGEGTRPTFDTSASAAREITFRHPAKCRLTFRRRQLPASICIRARTSTTGWTTGLLISRQASRRIDRLKTATNLLSTDIEICCVLLSRARFHLSFLKMTNETLSGFYLFLCHLMLQSLQDLLVSFSTVFCSIFYFKNYTSHIFCKFYFLLIRVFIIS